MSRSSKVLEGFRRQRIEKIEKGEAIKDLPLDGPPHVVLHMLPHTSLQSLDLGPFNLPMSELEQETENITTLAPFLPIAASYNQVIGGGLVDEGLLVYARPKFDIRGNPVEIIEPETKSAYSYLQVFRDGSIEVVRASYYRGGHKLIHANYERDLLEAAPRCLRIQEALGVTPPVTVYVTLSGVLGAQFSDDSMKPWGTPLTQTTFFLSEILVEGFRAEESAKFVDSLKERFQELRAAGA